jgi:hypothetical protein
MRDLTAAIISLYPTAVWELNGDGYGGLVWRSDDIAKPTEQELVAECDRLQAEHDRTEYQRNRAPEYPPIGDQLDALWKGGDAAAQMLAKVQAVKAKYPKPTE